MKKQHTWGHRIEPPADYLRAMIYQVIGCMSGSSMDGLDIAFCILEEQAGQWKADISISECVAFDSRWNELLPRLTQLTARELLLEHSRLGHWIGVQIKQFIERHQLEHRVHFIGSHGHTVFHEPASGMTFQLGEGAAIAAETGLPVISDLRSMDVALGGQGAPVVPIGELVLWKSFTYFLNIGGIANISLHEDGKVSAFDVCAANRVLNLLASERNQVFDAEGTLAASGQLNNDLLNELNSLSYYNVPPPKSLANEFGTETVYRLIKKYPIPVEDQLRTYCEHIVQQIDRVVPGGKARMMLSGGGALNTFLVNRLREVLEQKEIEVILPDRQTIEYKEALVMALMAALRWREETNVLESVTGARRSSAGGALWMGNE
ncbi:MAG TPA: anhydro-N-acetylmuramic acid kinase [Chitinophagaceae bacterium]|nr:anhydro-N-acetylmuramic acid kinase [Chitinophagaceae bacterium]